MNPNYAPAKKITSLSALKKRLWKEFSLYVRRRKADSSGYTRCFTCGKRSHWKDLDAGHYIPKSVGGANLYFNERNVHPQCTYCNRHMHGNLSVYASRLIEEYGPGIIHRLEAWKKQSRPYSSSELLILIKHYKKLNGT